MTISTDSDSTLSDPARQAVRGFARATRLLERSARELSIPHYRVLSSVAAGEERASRVAERLELGRPAISSAVEALSAQGYLERREVQGDQRAFDLRVTPEGAAVLERMESEMTEALLRLSGCVEDGAQLISALATLDDAVDELYAQKRAARLRGDR